MKTQKQLDHIYVDVGDMIDAMQLEVLESERDTNFQMLHRLLTILVHQHDLDMSIDTVAKEILEKMGEL